jgi:terminase large subunit-like protein
MFDRAEYNRFCSFLRIDSKEFGTVPLRHLGTQLYLLDEIEEGLSRGIHDFVVLKARQLGISTESWALDLYWMFKHPGLRGTLVTHDEETREESRANLSSYLDSLPKAYKIPVRVHNRVMLELKNRSRLSYQVAGTKKSTKLGRGKGINFLHATEISSYGDEDAFDSLLASLAESYSDRLYIFESTALGFNLWYDVYKEAENSVSQKAIFIGWWRNELYQVEKDSQIFEVYGHEDPTPSEWEWIDGVKRQYNFTITPEQLAWSRWKFCEKHRENETTFFQEFPPLPQYAFQMHGSKFFSNKTLTGTKIMLDKEQPAAEHFRYNLGATFEETALVPTQEWQAHLSVWEQPDPLGVYVISGDPAYGSSTDSDRYCIQVLKCFADGVDQVAEFATTECTAYAFAWIIAHLAGGYRESTVILEINGPGNAVWQEFQRLQQTAGYTTNYQVNQGLLDVVGNVRNYLYHRPDSLAGNFAWHFKTTNEQKEMFMNEFRDTFERGLLVMRSEDLLDEMKTITHDDGVIGAGSSRQKDDRAIAMGLAIHAWKDSILPDLWERRWTRAEHFKQLNAFKTNGSVFQNHLSEWLSRFNSNRPAA